MSIEGVYEKVNLIKKAILETDVWRESVVKGVLKKRTSNKKCQLLSSRKGPLKRHPIESVFKKGAY